MEDKNFVTFPTGERVRKDDTDALLDIHMRCTKMSSKMQVTRMLIAKMLADRTPDSDLLTRRSEGKVFRATIKMPGQAYDQKKLRHLWEHTDEKTRARVLKIAEIGIQKKELKLLESSDCPPSLKLLVTQIIAAGTGPAGNPRIEKIERIESEKLEGIEPSTGSGSDDVAATG